jgi:hypothetical protein
MNETEHRQVLRQRAGARQQGLEAEVGHGGSHALGNKPMKGCPTGLALEDGKDSSYGKPKLPFVGHGGQLPEEVVVFASRKT